MRRIVLALLIAGAVAAALGLLVAWRLARPLRRTAAAAHSLAAGNRDVTLPAQGPTEVVEVSEAINTLAGALRHSESRQREFLLSVSHDLRTPLTAIAGYAESLAEGVVPPAEAAQVGRRHARARPSGSSGWSATCSTWPGSARRTSASTSRRSTSARSRADIGARVVRPRGAPPAVRLRLEAAALPVWTHTDRRGCAKRWTGCSTTPCG